MIHFEDFIMQDEADKYNMLQECNAYIKSKDKEIERLKEDNEYLNKVNIELSTEKNRLNNNWNELEKYMNENYIYDDVGMKIFDASVLQDKLQELKGSDKE